MNGCLTKRVRLTEPNKQAPYGGNGCSPHGLVVRMFSQNQLLFISLTRSIKIKPGSAKSYVLDIMTSHKRRALMVLYTRQATLPASTPSVLVRYLPLTGHSRHTTCSASFTFKPSTMASFSVTGKANFHSASALTASINSLVIKQDKLN